MSRMHTGRNVYEAAISRLTTCYKEGHRLIIAFSAGKDSGVLLECAIKAATIAGRLPVEVMFRDDEILYPGTAEYAERIANRKEVEMHWLVNRQAVPNIYNRALPFFWAFDTEIPESAWVRKYPDYYEEDLVNINLYYITNTIKFPPPPGGKKLVSVVGIRTEESSNRNFAIQSSKGPRSYAPNDPSMFNLYPIYDWKVGDVWLAIKEFGWDYNHAYDVLMKMGVPKQKQRMSQIAMTPIGSESLAVAAKSWPKWWDSVTERLPGIRSVVYYGDKVLRPIRKTNETWKECFIHNCIVDAPDWIKDRSTNAMNKILESHHSHSVDDLPDVIPCIGCKSSWKTLANALYSGDPWHVEISWLPDLEASIFRKSETRQVPQSHKFNK